MRFEAYFNWVQKQMVHHPKLDFYTVKFLFDKLRCYLSPTEKAKYGFMIDMITTITEKQLKIDDVMLQLEIEKMDKDLNKLVKDDKEVKRK